MELQFWALLQPFYHCKHFDQPSETPEAHEALPGSGHGVRPLHNPLTAGWKGTGQKLSELELVTGADASPLGMLRCMSAARTHGQNPQAACIALDMAQWQRGAGNPEAVRNCSS